ncbi:EamA family transporter [Vibrio profundum]|uniref:EamA family transporter n=1 Tax=Vibrio profundum TaxID=2910247 RepID=UPI003D14A644
MSRKDFLLTLLVMTIWGVNFSMIKLTASEVDPLLVTAIRFMLASLPMVFFIPKPNVQWRYLIGYGVLFGMGVWGIAAWSITAGLSSGISSILLQSNVMLGIAVGVIFFRERLSKNKLVGSLISLVALVIMVASNTGNVTESGLALIGISAISWTLVGVIVKLANTRQIFAFNVWGMLFAPAPLILLAVLLHGKQIVFHAVQVWDLSTSSALFFQVYPTTLFGYWVWNRMLLKYPLSSVMPMTLLVPIFALISGYFVFGEVLSQMQIAASGLFILGIGLIVKPIRSQQVETSITSQGKAFESGNYKS